MHLSRGRLSRGGRRRPLARLALLAGALWTVAPAGADDVPLWRLMLPGSSVEVTRSRARLRVAPDAPSPSWSSFPMDVFDACADPRRPFVYLVLGLGGEERGNRFAVLEAGEGAVRAVFIDRNRGYNPWKVLSGDVDGDGEAEVVYAVYKKARFHPVLANRLFVFGWDGRQLYPKWLGSRLSRPFRDVALKDLDGDGTEELIALEEEKGGGLRVMSYRWSGFGFEGERELARGGTDLRLGTAEFAGGKP